MEIDGKMMHIALKKGEVGEYCILPGDPGRVEKIAKYLDGAKKIAQNREYTTYTGSLSGVPVSVCSTGIGGPSTAIAVEELSRCGVHTFVRIGTCGGIDLSVLPGDIVISTGAIRMEGTSREYAPIEYPAVPSFDVCEKLKQAAVNLGLPYHMGVSQCKDSFYGQHSPQDSPVGDTLIEKWEAWKRLGVLASEMEGAALFTVGAAKGVRTGACFSTVWNQERAAKGFKEQAVHDTDAAIRVAVEAIRLLIQSDT